MKLIALRTLLLIVGWWIPFQAQALQAVDLDYYLSDDIQYDEGVPTPKEYFGFEIGDRHLYHHEIVGYMRRLAEVSDRITIEEYARSHGGRPLVMLTITAPAHHANIDQISRQHRELADPATSPGVDVDRLPVVVNLGYSVHGNEPSASNVSPLVAYHLAAAQGEKIDSLLNDAVILLDPCLNPDGLERFAQWANDHRGQVLNPDGHHREHAERWPSGRTNYYWFDLNRDWLPAQHPESQGRLKIARRWIPNLVLDFHEMGGNSTYFFQPGVPRRTNPLTPQTNIDLTHRMSEFHAAALDSIRSLYFMQERFDDFYSGKGSTYPDLHGAVGILFEQASSRGHLAETENGELAFPFTIRNQYKTSLSSLEAAQSLRSDLLAYKRTFYQDALALARATKRAGYVVSADGDRDRLRAFLTILHRHGIRFAPLKQSLSVDGFTYRPDRDYFIPTEQPEYRFLADLFARRTTFEESIFYDIATWTLPLAFNLRYAEISTPPDVAEGDQAPPDAGQQPVVEFSDQDVAYIVDWQARLAPKTLYRLLDADIRVKVAQQPFDVALDDNTVSFTAGAILVPLSLQEEKRPEIRRILEQAAGDDTPVLPVQTSVTAGIDLGSSSFASLQKPRVLLVVGRGTSTYEAGEVWHLLDTQYGVPVTLVDTDRFGGVTLSDYNTVILVSGSYSAFGKPVVESLQRWIADGGTLLSIGTAVRWIDQQKIAAFAVRKDSSLDEEEKESGPPPRLPYGDAADTAALKLISGAIFQTDVDITHPIGYGYVHSRLPLFRDHEVILERSDNPYATPVAYTSDPLLSGYVSPENLERLKESAGVVVAKRERGRVVAFAGNPNFRAFWYGTNRLFLNAILFGPTIGVPSP